MKGHDWPFFIFIVCRKIKNCSFYNSKKEDTVGTTVSSFGGLNITLCSVIEGFLDLVCHDATVAIMEPTFHTESCNIYGSLEDDVICRHQW